MTVMDELHTDLEPVVTELFDRHLANRRSGSRTSSSRGAAAATSTRRGTRTRRRSPSRPGSR